MNIQEKIIQATSEYFEENIDYYKLSKASKEYKSILEEVCGEDMNIEEGRSDIHFNNGKSLGTFWAALCLDDLIRTRQFIRGIEKAIKDKIDTKDKIHILYAGTGPFATLILPLIFRYSKHDIKYTFLEINPFSFKVLQNVISKLGLNQHNITLVKDDATKYIINPENNPDIIISETMQNALAKEQQVPIFLNLMNQVASDTIFIPEKIELSIGLKSSKIPIEDFQSKHYHKEKKVFEVSRESMFSSKESKVNEISFPKEQTVIKNETLKDFNQLLLITEIQVYKNEKIAINESGLTTPITINNIPENIKGPITIDTKYQISYEPKLEYEIHFS